MATADESTTNSKEDRPGTEDDKKKWFSLDYLSDVPLNVIVELGQANVTLAQLLTLGKGSTIELNKLAGEPLEFNVGGTLSARGEVVVINERFGIRLTDVISPEGDEKKGMG